MIYKESVISILENRQKETCPIGLYSRNKADDIEAFDFWQELIDAVEAIPEED